MTDKNVFRGAGQIADFTLELEYVEMHIGARRVAVPSILGIHDSRLARFVTIGEELLRAHIMLVD